MLHYLVRPHLEQPQQPIWSPAAWRGDELGRSGQWTTTLTPGELGEVERALAGLRQSDKPLRELSAADFPLPTLQRRIKEWAGTLASGRGVQVIRGLPVHNWSPPDCERFFFCLGLHLGTPGAQNNQGDLLGHVRDQGLSYADPHVRGYRTAAKLAYHCDGADVVGLLCLRTARSGGQSRFVSSVAVWNELHARRPDLAARMFAPRECDTRGDGGLNFFVVAPCRYASGHLRTWYNADYFRSAAQHPGAHPLTAEDHELLDLYDEIAGTPGMYLEMDFQPGDIQLLSNHTVLHSRTAYVDHDEPEQKRHLLRVWVSLHRRVPWYERPSMAHETGRLFVELARGRLRDRGRVTQVHAAG
jgi:hypothetical protein